jgi:hypothetical protein
MNETADTASPNQEDAPLPSPPWLRATADDVSSIDFEAPLAGTTTASCATLDDLYRAAIKRGDGSTEPADTPTARVFLMLSAVTGMYFNPQDRHEPFGPMVVFANGTRSAVPSDFRESTDVLGEMAERAFNPVLRARLSDVCWLLDRKKAQLALVAVAAYTDIVQKTADGELKFGYEDDDGALEHDARDYLRRALQIGHVVGSDKPETLAARSLVSALREQALARGALVPIHWFADLDLDFRVSDAGEVGRSLDRFLADASVGADAHNTNELWRLAARAYHLARMEDDKNRCLGEAVEVLVAHAEAQRHSAMLASQFLSTAIAQLHGIPGKRERRTELRHRLIDIQAHLTEEMSVFSRELDLREIAEKVRAAVDKVNLLDKLFIFAALECSPDPQKLVDEAAELIRKTPLSSIFASSHHDREGKVIHRTPGTGFGDDASHPVIHERIAQNEEIRRKIVVSGKIEVARHTILQQHFISDDLLTALLRYSAFVPPDLIGTFSRAFTRFFQGDCVSATYILTPLLENSLRYVLKLNGHDVTTFDDATQTQEDRAISSLFEQMRPELDSILTISITADIERVFLIKPGPHLRHAVAHGLLHDGDPYGADAVYGCWLIFRLCLLPLFPHQDELRSAFEGSELCRK